MTGRFAEDDDSEEFYLVPLDDRTAVAIPVEPDKSSLPPLGDMLAVVGAAADLFKRSGAKGRLYELSPESAKILAKSKTSPVGSYFRGVTRTTEGKTNHQLQLREAPGVPATTAPTGLDVLMAAQMMAIQAQLGRIESALNEVALSVERVVSFLETEQVAEIKAVLVIVQDVFEAQQRSGVLGNVDWQRLTGTELIIQKQLEQVRIELKSRLEEAKAFVKDPHPTAEALKRLDPDRVMELVEAHRLLVGGLKRSYQLVLQRKFDLGELSDHEIDLLGRRVAELADRHVSLLESIDSIATEAQNVRCRSNWDRLWSDGLVMGANKDDNSIKAVKEGSETLRAAVEASKAPKIIEMGSHPGLEIVAEADGESLG